MSTDLAPATAATDLTRFAEEASQVHSIAKALASTAFVPKAFQNKPDEITGAILFGRALGLDPMIALQMIVPIEGRPAMYANAMRGLAQAHGVKFKVDTATDTRVVMSARAPGDPDWTTVQWPIERATKMGLTGKSNWQKMPQAMLNARATSELCRLVASNILLGLPYSVEELIDLPHEDARAANGTDRSEDAPPSPVPLPPRKTVRRVPVQATVAEPEPEPYEDTTTPDDDPEVSTAVASFDNGERAPMDINVRKALMARFNEQGIPSRADRLQKVSEIIGREVHSVNQLSTDEGKTVLRALDPAVRWPPAAEIPG